MSTTVEDAIKERLGIKWIHAKRLAEEAKSNLGENCKDDQVVEEAVKIFNRLKKAEQKEMLVSKSSEPDWKRKARQQTEKREQHWDPAARQGTITRVGPTSEGIKGPKKTITVTKTTRNGDSAPEIVETVTHEELQDNKIKHTTVHCTIL